MPNGSEEFIFDSDLYVYSTQKEYRGDYRSKITVQKQSYLDDELLWDWTGVILDTVKGNIYDREIDANGNFWVAWRDTTGSAFVQTVSPNGDLLFPRPGFKPNDIGTQIGSIAIKKSNDEEIIIIWKDNREGE